MLHRLWRTDFIEFRSYCIYVLTRNKMLLKWTSFGRLFIRNCRLQFGFNSVFRSEPIWINELSASILGSTINRNYGLARFICILKLLRNLCSMVGLYFLKWHRLFSFWKLFMVADRLNLVVAEWPFCNRCNWPISQLSNLDLWNQLECFIDFTNFGQFQVDILAELIICFKLSMCFDRLLDVLLIYTG